MAQFLYAFNELDRKPKVVDELFSQRRGSEVRADRLGDNGVRIAAKRSS